MNFREKFWNICLDEAKILTFQKFANIQSLDLS